MKTHFSRSCWWASFKSTPPMGIHSSKFFPGFRPISNHSSSPPCLLPKLRIWCTLSLSYCFSVLSTPVAPSRPEINRVHNCRKRVKIHYQIVEKSPSPKRLLSCTPTPKRPHIPATYIGRNNRYWKSLITVSCLRSLFAYNTYSEVFAHLI